MGDFVFGYPSIGVIKTRWIGLPWWSSGYDLSAIAGDTRLMPGQGRSYMPWGLVG